MKPRDLVLLFPLTIAACLPSLNDPDYGPLNETFAVSDFFSPSGFMGDGAKQGFLSVDFREEFCKQPRPTGARGRCYSFTYYMDGSSNMMWGGVYWVYPTNSWGARPGYMLDSARFKQVSFYAAVEMPTPSTKSGGGDCFFNGIAGGIDAKGFYGPTEHDDKIRAQEVYQVGTDIGPDYKQFHVSLANQPAAAELVGAFAWSIDFPSDSCTCTVAGALPLECTSMGGVLSCPKPVKIYLDDVVWDTAPPPTP